MTSVLKNAPVSEWIALSKGLSQGCWYRENGGGGARSSKE